MATTPQTQRLPNGSFPEKVFGLYGIAELFGVSKGTALIYKRKFLSPAIQQCGRVIITDTAEAYRLFSEFSERKGAQK